MPNKNKVHYHDRTKRLNKEQRTEGERMARSQEDVILSIIKSDPKKIFNQYDFEGLGYLDTSIRRALTNLKNEGAIREHSRTLGRYNKPINNYEITFPIIGTQLEAFI